MKKLVALLLFAGLVIYLWPQPQPEPEIRVAVPESQRDTNKGAVIGFRDRGDTFAWLGIPFAAAPVGESRWSAPRPAQAWPEPREALAFSEPCVQLWGPVAGTGGEPGQVVGSEDCLYLNVWAPEARSSEDTGGLPVMFWIHGGGNTIGTANTYPAGRLASSEDVVVVTINYRLGLLGWLSHPILRGPDRDPMDASGNYGILDMIAALTWVRDNIARFGGDPDNVTIFGESAGGRNVFSLMASPPARGLFHRVISQSGLTSTVPLWRAENYADDEKPGHSLSSREWLLRQLQQAGVAADRDGAREILESMSELDLLSFMHSRTPEQILQGLEAGAGMYQAAQNFRDGAVLPEQTLFEVFRDPDAYNSVPLITGTNRDEMKLFLAQSPEFVERRFGFMPRIKDPIVYEVVNSYLNDRWKALAVDEAAAIISTHGGAPVYAYRWDWDEGGSNWIVDYPSLLGAAHGLEVAYIFNDFEDGIMVPGLYNEENIPGRDTLSRQMRSYWSEFARSGDPGQGRNGDLPLWEAWENGGDNLMILDTQAGGGLRMAEQPTTVAMLKERVATGMFPDLKTRCTMFAQLFLHANDGADIWDEQEFIDLGCGEYDPWALEPGG
jgi:para-nitrobenzyl esterase